jgi:hypothetical protein
MCSNKILKYLRNVFVLGYTGASLGEQILAFRRIIVPSNSSVKMSKKSDIQTLDNDGNTILGKPLTQRRSNSKIVSKYRCAPVSIDSVSEVCRDSKKNLNIKEIGS